jgi:hypothetical protein
VAAKKGERFTERLISPRVSGIQMRDLLLQQRDVSSMSCLAWSLVISTHRRRCVESSRYTPIIEDKS